MNATEKQINFGTGEEPADVRAKDLVPGVWIDGYKFDVAPPVLVQDVIGPDERGRVLVIGLHHESGRQIERLFGKNEPLKAWGRL